MRLVRCNLRRSFGLAVLAAGLATLATFGSGAALAAGDAAKGKQNFMKYGCWQCHGTVGQGGVGPKLAPEPMAFEALSSFVRNTNRQMPPYREAVLPNQDLEDIYAYLSSIPKPADYKTIPLLAE
jgi:mono/diheme cytochrome c family protein